MDLLAGYGSDDSGSDTGEAAPQAAAPSAAAYQAVPQRASLSGSLLGLPPPQQPGGSGPGRSGLFASLPAPSNDDGPGFDAFGLAPQPAVKPAAAPPAPKPTARKVVQLRTLKPLAPDEDEEDEQPKKKLRTSTKGLSFLDSLPKPVHYAGPPAGTALGAGSASARALGGGLHSDPVASSTLPGSFFDGDGASGAELDAAASAAQHVSNDAYRVSPAEAAAAASYDAEVGPARPPAGGYESTGAYGGYGGGGGRDGGAGHGAAPAAAQQRQHHYGGQPGYGPAAPAARPDGDAMLAAAIAADSGRGGGGAADPFAGTGIKFKEVNQKSLTYVDPARAAAKQGLRQALGKEHELQLRKEADAVEPEKLAKRKHQISSLYHAAKLKELEMLSDHGGMLKTKRETQAKYGW